MIESHNCLNQQYLRNLTNDLNDKFLDKYEDTVGNLQPADPNYVEFMSDHQALQDVTELRFSCSKFVLGATVETGRVTPDLEIQSCMLNPGENCPIQQQADAVKQQYGNE